jgi:hypothetical protein
VENVEVYRLLEKSSELSILDERTLIQGENTLNLDFLEEIAT